MRHYFLVLLTGLVAALPSLADTAEAEITYLIDQVAQSNCFYIRNGNEHDAAEAADHLRLKYRRGKRYADTAENFIDRLASESSWSGDAYQMRCGETTEASRDWLYRALRGHRSQTAAPAQDAD
jgi:hypothetical protein